MERDRAIEDRLRVLTGAGREDWRDVRRRARAHGYAPSRRRWILAAVVTAAVAVAAGPPVGRSVADLFRDPDKPALPRSSFDPLMRLELDRRYGEWSAHRIATDGRTTFYALRNRDGDVVCVMQGRANWKEAGWRSPFGSMSCGDPGQMLPAGRPLYYQVAVEVTATSGGPRPFRVTGVAEDGIEKIVLTGTGERLEFDVEEHAFTITRFPEDAQSIRIEALDGDGNVVYRERLQGFGPAPMPGSPTRRPGARPELRAAPLTPRPGARPIQRGRGAGAELLVYRDGLVVFRIEPGSRGARLAGPSFSCLDSAEVDGESVRVTVAGSGRLSADRTRLAGRAFRPLVEPPYDGCEVGGTGYGVRWNDPRGVRAPVEVPLTPAGREYYETRAVARDLAEFLRSPKIVRLRRALRRDAGRRYPPAGEIRRTLPPRVIAGAPPRPGQIAIRSDGRRLVVEGRATTGTRVFVELEGGRVVRHNFPEGVRLA